MGLETIAIVTTAVAGATASTAAAVEQERAGRRANRESKKRQDVILERGEDEADRRREAAARIAATQIARGGAAGVRTSAAFLVQENLLESFDQVGQIRKAAAIEATAVRKQGRNARKRANTAATISYLRAFATLLGGAVQTGLLGPADPGLAGAGLPTGPGTGLPSPGQVPLTGV